MGLSQVASVTKRSVSADSYARRDEKTRTGDSPAPIIAAMSDLARFGVAMEPVLLEAFDRHIARRGYENRSEALRDLVRAELARDAWNRDEQTVATISLIYDHHVRELTDRLVEIQHEHGDHVIAATHVHLDHDHCLEVILARVPRASSRGSPTV